MLSDCRRAGRAYSVGLGLQDHGGTLDGAADFGVGPPPAARRAQKSGPAKQIESEGGPLAAPKGGPFDCPGRSPRGTGRIASPKP